MNAMRSASRGASATIHEESQVPGCGNTMGLE
jgi:hypothetical protein